MATARWVGTPNFGYGAGRSVLGLVVHSTEGGLAGSLAALRAPYDPATGRGGASAHYVIAEDGTVYQLVQEDDVAFHVAAFGNVWQLNRNRPSWLPPYAGNWSAVNQHTIGYELVGFAGVGFTVEQYEALGQLCAQACDRWHIPVKLQPEYDREATIITHGYLQTDRSDPGPYFDWEALRGFLTMNDTERQGLLARIAALEADQARCNAVKAELEAWIRAREGKRLRVAVGTADQLIGKALAG